MGCGTSSDAVSNYVQPDVETEKPTDEKKPEKRSPAAAGKHLMFEVPIGDEESVIKKHPPMRLQRLEEQQVTPPEITLEMLQKRQAEAEERRRRILDQRIQSAQQFQQKLRVP